MPLLEPSQTGFTMAGKQTSGSGSPALTTRPGATSTKGETRRLATSLSRLAASVSASDPV
jgi:hypothetical protein